MLKHCPLCGHVDTPKRPRRSAPIGIVDTSELTDEQARAYFKRTAPAADVQFWIDYATMSVDLRDRFLELGAEVPNLNRGELYRQLLRLQADWRRESNARDEHPIGTWIEPPAEFEAEPPAELEQTA